MGALLTGTVPAESAPICVLNHTDQRLFLTVDSQQGQRIEASTIAGGKLCLEAAPDVSQGVVGVFSSDQSLEGCSRLTRPNQPETLLDFHEFDNCRWADTPRGFSVGTD